MTTTPKNRQKHSARVHKPSNSYVPSDIVYSAPQQPVALQNLNQNYVRSDPKRRGTCKKRAPYLSTKKDTKKTLVVDLDETLVHASFKPVAGADISKLKLLGFSS